MPRLRCDSLQGRRARPPTSVASKLSEPSLALQKPCACSCDRTCSSLTCPCARPKNRQKQEMGRHGPCCHLSGWPESARNTVAPDAGVPLGCMSLRGTAMLSLSGESSAAVALLTSQRALASWANIKIRSADTACILQRPAGPYSACAETPSCQAQLVGGTHVGGDNHSCRHSCRSACRVHLTKSMGTAN